MNRLSYFLKRHAASLLSLETRFANIYRAGKWSGGGDETRSGAGSTMLATSEIRARLPDLLLNVGANRVLDIGCGDFNWMKAISLPCEYHGVDIVRKLIEDNERKYSNSRISFSFLNAVTDPLPSGYDVIICREVLFHLSFSDIQGVLRNIVASDAKFILTTSSAIEHVNGDIASGQFRNLNLQRSPFNFPAPEGLVDDAGVSEGRFMGLWKIADIDGSFDS